MSQKRKLRGGGNCQVHALCPHAIRSWFAHHNKKINSSYISEIMKGLLFVIKTSGFSVRWELNEKNIASQRVTTLIRLLFTFFNRFLVYKFIQYI